jgi:hypothetical protein
MSPKDASAPGELFPIAERGELENGAALEPWRQHKAFRGLREVGFGPILLGLLILVAFVIAAVVVFVSVRFGAI